MDSIGYVLIALGLGFLCFILIKMAHSIRRVGFLRLAKAYGSLIAAVAGAIGGLMAIRQSDAKAESEERLTLTDQEDRPDKAWDKVGAVSAPEQYLHHSDPEVSGLAQAHLDNDQSILR